MPLVFVQAVSSLEGGDPAKTYLYRTQLSENLKSKKKTEKIDNRTTSRDIAEF